MQKKVHRVVLPLVLALVGLAIASGAGASTFAWTSPNGAAMADASGIEKPEDVTTFNGDPDSPTVVTQKRLGISGPSDGSRHWSLPSTWYGHQSVLLRVYLSRWFGL